MSFRLIQKSVTLNNIERRNGRYSALFCVISANWVALDAHCVKWLKIYLNFLQQKCRPKCLVFLAIITYVDTMYGTPLFGGLNARGVASTQRSVLYITEMDVFPHAGDAATDSDWPRLDNDVVFTARRSYVSAVLGVVIMSVCPSVTRVLCD